MLRATTWKWTENRSCFTWVRRLKESNYKSNMMKYWWMEKQLARRLGRYGVGRGAGGWSGWSDNLVESRGVVELSKYAVKWIVGPPVKLSAHLHHPHVSGQIIFTMTVMAHSTRALHLLFSNVWRQGRSWRPNDKQGNLVIYNCQYTMYGNGQTRSTQWH